MFVAFVAFFTWSAFLVASLAWWAEFGSALLMQSARHPPKTWEEAWRMHGLFKRSIGASLEGSLGLDRGTIFAGGHDLAAAEDFERFRKILLLLPKHTSWLAFKFVINAWTYSTIFKKDILNSSENHQRTNCK